MSPRRQFRRLLFGLVCLCNLAMADDVEVYTERLSTVYLHVLMDLGDADQDEALCIVGIDCAPPFMSFSAQRYLLDWYPLGQPVTAPLMFRAVLAAVLARPAFADVQVALQIANHPLNRAPDGSAGGGSFIMGYRPMDTGLEQLVQLFARLPSPAGASAHAFQPKESYMEWLLYVRGMPVALGRNTRGNFGMDSPDPDVDSSILRNGRYVSDAVSLQCPRLYSLLFSQGEPSGDDALDGIIQRELGATAAENYPALIRRMRSSQPPLLPLLGDQGNVQSLWVASSRARAGHASHYALAGAGGAVMYVDEPRMLERQLSERLMRTASQPVLNYQIAFAPRADGMGPSGDVFLAMSQVASRVNWQGNVKKLRMSSLDGGMPQWLDVNGRPAMDVTGAEPARLRFDALTFWTDVDTLSEGDGINIPRLVDGPVVTRGGAGQKIDGFVPYTTGEGASPYAIGLSNDVHGPDGIRTRQVYIESSTGMGLLPLDASVETVAALRRQLDTHGGLDDDQWVPFIRWARGLSQEDEQPRPWLMGDMLHSRPLVINYGATEGYSDDHPNIRLFFGSGDGLFRMLENTSSSGEETGRERFAFYPKAVLPHVVERYRNRLRASRQTDGVGGQAVALRIDVNRDGIIRAVDGDEVIVFFGLRRGGSAYYALDVTDPDAVPRLLWRIDGTNTPGFNELALSFSTPVVTKVAFDGEIIDALIFGGGYWGGWNAQRSERIGKDFSAGNDLRGNAVFVVNARTGELIWKAVPGETGSRSNRHYAHSALVDSIPSTVAVLETAEGIAERVYVGDTGGALWRIDLTPGKSGTINHRHDHWFATKLADLGADQLEEGGSVARDLRFFHAPDLVRSRDALGAFDGVLISSGDRAHPLNRSARDYLFFVKDRLVATGAEAVRGEDPQDWSQTRYEFEDIPTTEVCRDAELGSLASCARTPGWKLALSEEGEKGIGRPLVDGGRVLFTTFVPTSNWECQQPGGVTRLHVVGLSAASELPGFVRVSELGAGLLDNLQWIGEYIYVPGQGALTRTVSDEGETSTARQPFIRSEAGRLYGLYWRDPSFDPL